MRIVNGRNNIIIADSVETASGALKQLKGLIGRRKLDPGSAMVFPGCRQVHTFFMQFPIDVIFISKENIVLRIVENLQRNGISEYVSNAAMVIELPAFTAADSRLRVGDRISFENNIK